MAQDIAAAVNEAGLRDWGRAPVMPWETAMRPLVRDIQRAHMARRPTVSFAASKAGRALKLLRALLRK